jgi:FkbM family methyltransferase
MPISRRLIGIPGVLDQVCLIRLRGIPQPFYIRAGTSDATVFDEVILFDEYAQLLRYPLGEMRLVLDLGANVGMFARFCQMHFPDAALVVVEPDAGSMAICKRNTSVYEGRQVKYVQACVAAAPGRVRLDRSRGAWGYRMSAAGNSAAAEAADAVDALTVPDVLTQAAIGSDTPIDLLKCDIEGAEQQVFADCRAWIGRVRNLITELHPPYTPDGFLADLRNNGGRFTLLDVKQLWGTHYVVLLQQTP